MFASLRNKRILVVAAHPDDEILGLGGAVHALAKRHGCTLRAVVLGEGVTSRSSRRRAAKWKAELKQHRSDMESARKIVGYASLRSHDFPDNRFDSVPLLDLIKAVEAEKADFRPEAVFTHHGGDLNIDHQRTSQAVLTAFRPLPGERAGLLLAFETASATEWQSPTHPEGFRPNVFLPITRADLRAKIAAMECYRFERRAYPHPRSPDALEARARHWGATAGTDFAEAFALLRAVGRD